MKLRTRHVALILSAAAIAAAGCGSSSKSKNTPATPATPTTASTTGTSTTAGPTSALATQMNTLCKQANAKTNGVSDLPKLASIVEPYVAKFEALKPSASEKASYDQYVAISTRCMHLGCPVRYVSAAERFICPCHGGVYDFQGKVAGGPPVRPLDRFYTRIRAGFVQIGPRYSVNPVVTPNRWPESKLNVLVAPAM